MYKKLSSTTFSLKESQGIYDRVLTFKINYTKKVKPTTFSPIGAAIAGKV